MLRDGDYVRVRQGAPYLAANKAGELGRVDGFCRNVPSVRLPSEHGASIGIDAEFLDVIDPLFYFAAKDAELAKLREQRDRLILKRYVENVNALQYGMSMVDAQRIVDAEIAEEFGVRIIDGKVEEIGNG